MSVSKIVTRDNLARRNEEEIEMNLDYYLAKAHRKAGLHLTEDKQGIYHLTGGRQQRVFPTHSPWIEVMNGADQEVEWMKSGVTFQICSKEASR